MNYSEIPGDILETYGKKLSDGTITMPMDQLTELVKVHTDNPKSSLSSTGVFNNCTFNNCTIVIDKSGNFSSISSTSDTNSKSSSMTRSTNDHLSSLLTGLSDNYENSIDLDKSIDTKSSDNSSIDKLVDQVTQYSEDNSDNYIPFDRDQNGHLMAWQIINLKVFPGVKLIKNYKNYFVLDFTDWIKSDPFNPNGLISTTQQALSANGIKFDYSNNLLTVNQSWRWARFEDNTLYPKDKSDYLTDDHPEDFTSEYDFMIISSEDLENLLDLKSSSEVADKFDEVGIDYELNGRTDEFKIYNSDEKTHRFMESILNSTTKSEGHHNGSSIKDIIKSKLKSELDEKEIVPDCIQDTPIIEQPNHPSSLPEEGFSFNSMNLVNQSDLINKLKEDNCKYNSEQSYYTLGYDRLIRITGCENQFSRPSEFNKQYLDIGRIHYDYDSKSKSYTIYDLSDDQYKLAHPVLLNHDNNPISESDLYNEVLTDKMKLMVRDLRKHIKLTNRARVNNDNQIDLLDYLTFYGGYNYTAIPGTGCLGLIISFDKLKSYMMLPNEFDNHLILEILYKNKIEYDTDESLSTISLYAVDDHVLDESSDIKSDHFWYNKIPVDGFGYTLEELENEPYNRSLSQYNEFLTKVKLRMTNDGSDNRYIISSLKLAEIFDIDLPVDINEEFLNNLSTNLEKILVSKYFRYTKDTHNNFIFKSY
jgi:hypothetical protein